MSGGSTPLLIAHLTANALLTFNLIVVKAISSIFNINLFDFCYFILRMINIIIIFRNIYFITIHVFIVNKISTNSSIDYEQY